MKTKRYKNLPKSDDKLKKVNLFTYSNQEFNGILNFFSKKSGGKIDSEISITSSSINPSDNSSNPRNVAYNNNNYFFSDNFVNSWICFDFKDYRVSPTNYTIKTVGNYYPKSWVIEGSNDNVSVEILDSQNNCSRLNNCSVVCTFTIGNQKNKQYRYIRMRQTGETWCGGNYLLIRTFEIYGQLLSKS